ncbi:unnamed protein product, partial [Amoebophrya sp. A120]
DFPDVLALLYVWKTSFVFTLRRFSEIKLSPELLFQITHERICSITNCFALTALLIELQLCTNFDSETIKNRS